MAKALFGGGCFWCLDAIFRRVDGIKDVVVGYSGGDVKNPTQLNRQGNDIGTQYRSIIFYFDEKQKEKVLNKINELKKNLKVVTEVVPFREFFKAEEYHQNYFDKNPNNPYCVFVIAPKVNKFLKEKK